MQEKTVKAGLLAIGILLVTSSCTFAGVYETRQALIIIAVGTIFIAASQYLHVERIGIVDIRRRLFEVEGTVRGLEKDMLEGKHN